MVQALTDTNSLIYQGGETIHFLLIETDLLSKVDGYTNTAKF
jgi:hypothetical protein